MNSSIIVAEHGNASYTAELCSRVIFRDFMLLIIKCAYYCISYDMHEKKNRQTNKNDHKDPKFLQSLLNEAEQESFVAATSVPYCIK